MSATLQAIFACVFEARSTLRLKHAGMEFAVWTFKHAAQEPLDRAAKPALQGLLMLLDNGAGFPLPYLLICQHAGVPCISQTSVCCICLCYQQHCCPADTAAGSDAASAAVRGFTYQAIGQLASRVPILFTSDVSIARRFFQSLSTEPAGVRSALQEAVSTLASAYQGCIGVTCLLISSTRLQ
jgi:proteasome component ECM29